jgi:hypothetical protein
MEKEIKFLEKYYGNHTRVAGILGITPRHWRRLRNQSLIPLPLKNLILAQTKILKTKEGL